MGRGSKVRGSGPRKNHIPSTIVRDPTRRVGVWIWNLGFFWDLGFGFWDFPPPLSPSDGGRIKGEGVRFPIRLASFPLLFETAVASNARANLQIPDFPINYPRHAEYHRGHYGPA